ncbi:dienelactone hydrolase family protein [Xanthomonas sp. XNM01]|uniref:dienelactone hydrolase family protein n=1 Tax=Xanthomonas sp. XNM01 TaxID=2769289 RepID=UPI00177C60B1|nr:dienelactone hydrolase family protein [Xanthomonas sp. XNM01]MBD9368768.1 dienelactone hydrolase family protein [Xanthomonas sp. XNM01]
MGQWLQFDTPSGRIGAWQADPTGPARGGLVVIQEIFGVNAHMRAVADGYAAEGYAVLAPAFFDPIERGVELDYSEAGFARGRELVGALGLAAATGIVASAADWLRAHLAARQAPIAVGSVGYCWGGSVALLAALRLGLPSVSYYGARNVQVMDALDAESSAFLQQPKAPVMFHFGQDDASIPEAAIASHRTRLPTMPQFVYPAGHAFNRDVDPRAWHPDSAHLARRRSLAFFEEHLA